MLIALRLSDGQWIDEYDDADGSIQLLPPPLLSIKLDDQSGHVVLFAKLNAARLSARLSTTVKPRMTMLEIVKLLVSQCEGSVLAITNNEDRKLRAREYFCQ